MKIHIDRSCCVSAGMCALRAPGVFAQARDDGRVVVLDDHPALAPAQDAARKACYLCPSGAITVDPDWPRAARGQRWYSARR